MPGKSTLSAYAEVEAAHGRDDCREKEPFLDHQRATQEKYKRLVSTVIASVPLL